MSATKSSVESIDDVYSYLRSKVLRAIKKFSGIRKPSSIDLFDRVAYIWPHYIRVKDLGGRQPYAAFNPGAVVKGKYVEIFPRIITGYFWYTSSIGFFRVRMEDLLDGDISGPIESRIILYPRLQWDMAGCEDPRVELVDNNYYVLYTALEPMPGRYHAVNAYSRQALAILDEDMNVLLRTLIGFKHDGRSVRIDYSKDSALLSREGKGFWMLTRPAIDEIAVAWRGYLSLDDYSISVETLEPIVVFEPWEIKTGWSTNAVKIGAGEYLVAWHGVGRDLVYRTGFAVVSSEGELRGITEVYLLEPKTVEEYAGDRPGVIFGDGLRIIDELLVLIAGVADTGIGVYTAPLEKVLEHIKWLAP